MSLEGSSVSVIRGWGCTPTGDLPPAAVSTEQRANKACLPTIFERGWRRNALYGIILFLMLLVFLNIALTLWIISALQLSMVRFIILFLTIIYDRSQHVHVTLCWLCFSERHRACKDSRRWHPVRRSSMGSKQTCGLYNIIASWSARDTALAP